jgi:hypothetical protein
MDAPFRERFRGKTEFLLFHLVCTEVIVNYPSDGFILEKTCRGKLWLMNTFSIAVHCSCSCLEMHISMTYQTAEWYSIAIVLI